MALSNWDTFALSTGPEADEITSPRGLRAEFYKNWLYLHSSQWWREGGGYSSDTIGEVHEGEFHLDDVNIKAIRGPQNGIYAVVSVGTKWNHAYSHVMVGCGVYGYTDSGDWEGVRPDSVDFLYEFATKELSSWNSASTLLAPSRWAETHRRNQGDEFFAKHLDLANPGTLPGVAEDPFLTSLLNR